jgi:hypothetical protein
MCRPQERRGAWPAHEALRRRGPDLSAELSMLSGFGRRMSFPKNRCKRQTIFSRECLPPGRGSAWLAAGPIVQPSRCASESLPVGGVAPLVGAIGADVFGVQFLPHIGAQ